MSALMEAAHSGSVKRVKELLDEGADMMEIPYSNLPCVFVSVEPQPGFNKDATATLRVFLDAGFDVNTKIEGNYTILWHAAKNGNADAVKLLIENGADVNHKTDDGINILHYVSEKMKNKPINIQMTATIDGKTVEMSTPEEVLKVLGRDLLAPFRGMVESAKILIKNGINIEEKNPNGQTPLMWAAHAGTEEMIELFIKSKADLNAQDNSGLSAVHFAGRGGHPDIIKLLVKAGADINLVERYGFSSLHEAAENNKPEVAKVLLELKIDQALELKEEFKPYKKGFTAADIAKLGGHDEISKLLK